MDAFTAREQGFELAFAHDEELRFKILACRNAMKMRNVKSEDLFPFAGEVDSGIAEIVRKQESGWAYIH